MLTLNSETSYNEDCLETKIKSKFDQSGQKFEQPEEELMDFIEQQDQESKQIEKKWLLSTHKHRSYQKLIK